MKHAHHIAYAYRPGRTAYTDKIYTYNYVITAYADQLVSPHRLYIFEKCLKKSPETRWHLVTLSKKLFRPGLCRGSNHFDFIGRIPILWAILRSAEYTELLHQQNFEPPSFQSALGDLCPAWLAINQNHLLISTSRMLAPLSLSHKRVNRNKATSSV